MHFDTRAFLMMFAVSFSATLALGSRRATGWATTCRRYGTRWTRSDMRVWCSRDDRGCDHRRRCRAHQRGRRSRGAHREPPPSPLV